MCSKVAELIAHDAHEPALMYAALGKKAVLQGLFRSSGNKRVRKLACAPAAAVGGGGLEVVMLTCAVLCQLGRCDILQ
jgi:hypothetical protein